MSREAEGIPGCAKGFEKGRLVWLVSIRSFIVPFTAQDISLCLFPEKTLNISLGFFLTIPKDQWFKAMDGFVLLLAASPQRCCGKMKLLILTGERRDIDDTRFRRQDSAAGEVVWLGAPRSCVAQIPAWSDLNFTKVPYMGFGYSLFQTMIL